jgi:enamine deaminase RidA (YjgF/YER057c/UK114 family)
MTLVKQVVPVPELGDDLPFAQCVVAGDFVFIAGQTGIDKDFQVVSHEFGPQVRRAFENLGVALAAGGAGFADIVDMTVYLADARFGGEFGGIRREFMGDSLCASTMICGVNYVLPYLLAEIHVTAVRGNAHE